MTSQSRPHRLWAVQVLLLCLLFSPALAHAQETAGIEQYLLEISDLTETALEASRHAEQASSVAEIKQAADAVFETIWGIPSGLVDESARGAANVHGWKTRWQVTYTDFDSAFAARYGDAPPEIEDPGKLGIIGRGRHIRNALTSELEGGSSSNGSPHTLHVIESLNNVIGWMKMDDGVTKGERQPRVDLTREWDSPIEFWMSTADTGWLNEVFAQAVNILKTDYEGDVEMARQHAAGMTQLLEKALNGVDNNGNGSIEPVKMEGGIATALQHARLGGYIQN